jgi:hypothetical protein
MRTPGLARVLSSVESRPKTSTPRAIEMAPRMLEALKKLGIATP